MGAANVLIDNALGASTLGTQVLSMVLLLLLLAPAGRTLAIDARIAAMDKNVVARWMHRLSGHPSKDRLILAKLAALSAYASLCLYSVIWHLHDEAWMSGLAVTWVLLFPGSNPAFSEIVGAFYAMAPAFYVELTRLALFGMIAWYILVLPGIFMGRYIRAFVIYWGTAFFLISAFVLPLSFLGYYELLFWLALFGTGSFLGAGQSQAMSILFDDRCNLCDRTVRTLAALDFFRRLEFRPLRRNKDLLIQHNITIEQGLTDLAGIDPSGQVYWGYELYLVIAKRLIILWPLVPLLQLGQITRIGPALYRFIAERRTSLFGVCEFSSIPDRFTRPSAPLHLAPPAKPSCTSYLSLPKAVVLSLLVLEAAFLVRLPISGVTGETTLASWSRKIFGTSPLAFGIGKINVFDSADFSLFKRGWHYYEESAFKALDAPSAHETATMLSLPLLSDAQRYWIVAQKRRMSRMNVGCDREFFNGISGQIKLWGHQSSALEGQENLILEITVLEAPTAEELNAHKVVEVREVPLCRAVANLTTGELRDLVFIQDGLDKALVEKGYKPALTSGGIEAALAYPCRLDGGFLNTIIDANVTLTADEQAVRAGRNLLADIYGRHEIDCLFEALALTERWPAILTSKLTAPTPHNCSAGIALLGALRKLSLSDEIAREIQEQYDQAVLSQSQGDLGSCLRASLEGRASYWRFISKHGGGAVAHAL